MKYNLYLLPISITISKKVAYKLPDDYLNSVIGREAFQYYAFLHGLPIDIVTSKNF